MPKNPYSVHYHQIQTPPKCYTGEIPNGLQVGKHIYVCGSVFGDVKRFAINLETRDQTALHFNPRFDENCVVRNSYLHSGWGAEERSGGFPFTKSSFFEIDIKCLIDKFIIIVNKGAAVYEYRHRLNFRDIQKISINENIFIQKITFYFESIRGLIEAKPNGVLSIDMPLQKFQPGKLIQIKGFTHSSAENFGVNLQNGAGDNQDVALVVNVRFGEQNGVVVRNNKCNSRWGREERDQSNFPFRKGSSFEILIFFDHENYKIAVNGVHFADFAYRNPEMGKFLHIFGDVDVFSIKEF